MEIKNFKMDGMKRIAENFYNTKYVNTAQISNILSTSNVSFVAIGLTRAESTLLCELKDSYVQQSQRYCDMGDGGYKIPQVLSDNDKDTARKLIDESFSLYNRMTELKDGVTTKRPKIEDFKYGIPYEDARYIFPLACLTNVSVSMSGDKLIDLFRMCEMHGELTKDFYNELKKCIDSRIVFKIQAYVEHSTPYLLPSEEYFNGTFNDIPNSGILRIYADSDVSNIAIGALTSTNPGDPTESYDESKSIGVIDRVAFGYGHMGILEQSRNTYGFSCSLSAYHQVIRHRIATLHRESIATLLYKREPVFYVPETIKKSEFGVEYANLTYKYLNFIQDIRNSYPVNSLFPLLLNCTMVKFISSSNARNDMYIFRERLCNRAQKEIRELYQKKYEDLMEVMPDVYKHAGPPCVNGACKEGKMSCGTPFKKKEVNV